MRWARATFVVCLAGDEVGYYQKGEGGAKSF